MWQNKNIEVVSEKDKVLFLVASPFQVLCAYEAINSFHLKDYTVLVIYDLKDIRTKQLFNTLRYFSLKYTTYIAESTRQVFEIIFKNNVVKELEVKSKYDAVFVGDYPSAVQRSFAVRYVKKQGQIICMDDGNTSLLILLDKKVYSLKAKLFNIFFGVLSNLKRIKENVFFTTYSEIPTKKKVISNDLISLKSADFSKEGVYFIGTNSVPYCEVHQIKIDTYYEMFEKILLLLKEKQMGQRCYYVFHGRDIGNTRIEGICQKCGFETLKLDEIVEMFFLKNRIEPLMVEGFSSSALFNLKKMFPCSKIVDVNVKTSTFVNEEYEMISLYYKNIGIEEIDVVLNNDAIIMS